MHAQQQQYTKSSPELSSPPATHQPAGPFQTPQVLRVPAGAMQDTQGNIAPVVYHRSQQQLATDDALRNHNVYGQVVDLASGAPGQHRAVILPGKRLLLPIQQYNTEFLQAAANSARGTTSLPIHQQQQQVPGRLGPVIWISPYNEKYLEQVNWLQNKAGHRIEYDSAGVPRRAHPTQYNPAAASHHSAASGVNAVPTKLVPGAQFITAASSSSTAPATAEDIEGRRKQLQHAGGLIAVHQRVDAAINSVGGLHRQQLSKEPHLEGLPRLTRHRVVNDGVPRLARPLEHGELQEHHDIEHDTLNAKHTQLDAESETIPGEETTAPTTATTTGDAAPHIHDTDKTAVEPQEPLSVRTLTVSEVVADSSAAVSKAVTGDADLSPAVQPLVQPLLDKSPAPAHPLSVKDYFCEDPPMN
eukprot:Lankesteria_metandrocarpae@DN5592_c0_g1_i1.p1